MEIDYKALLTKYIRHVRDIAGSDLIQNTSHLFELTYEDTKALEELSVISGTNKKQQERG